jgi:hypothetical protein
MYKPGICMKAKKGRILANYIKPYFDRHFDGLYNYAYIPPEKPTEYTGAALCGGVAHICFDIFGAYGESFPAAHRILIKQLLEKLLPDPLVRADSLPESARVTLTGNAGCRIAHIKVTFPECKGKTGVIDRHVIQPAGSIIRVKGIYGSALTGSDGKELPVRHADGYTEITLPQIEGYLMVVLR